MTDTDPFEIESPETLPPFHRELVALIAQHRTASLDELVGALDYELNRLTEEQMDDK